MSPAQRLRALAKRTALDGIAEELVAIAAELDQRPEAQTEREAFEAWARPNGYDLRRNDVLGHYSSIDTSRAWAGFRAGRASLPAPQQATPEPIPMVLHCPKCGMQHIDGDNWEELRIQAAESGRDREGDRDLERWLEDNEWNNPPHRSHLCHGCGTIWRPADVPTTGVKSISTKGKADTWEPVQAATPEPVGEPYTLIAMGFGRYEVGAGTNGGVPCIAFGRNGNGDVGTIVTEHPRQMSAEETVAVITFANVEGLNVLQEKMDEVRELYFGDTRPAPGVRDAEDLRDRLVAISAAVADCDDRAAQSMLSETLRLLAAAQAKGDSHG